MNLCAGSIHFHLNNSRRKTEEGKRANLGCRQRPPWMHGSKSIAHGFPWQPWSLVRGRQEEWWWLEAGWKATQASEAQAPKFGLMFLSKDDPLQKAPRGSRVWEIKLGLGSRRPGLRLCHNH